MQIRFKTLQDAFPGAHLEKMRGSVADNHKYVLKIETRAEFPNCQFWINCDPPEEIGEGLVEAWDAYKPPKSAFEYLDSNGFCYLRRTDSRSL